MATSAEANDPLNCGKCSKPYNKATMLECVHSFCRDCVALLIKTSTTNDAIACPTCDTPSTVPSNGVDGFARNVRLDNQVKMALIRTKEDLECQRCRRKDDRAAVEFCKQCNRLLCKACVNNHEVDIDYDAHERISINEFRHGKVKVDTPTRECTIHYEVLKWHCPSHDTIHCETCRIEDHSKCKVQGFKRAAEGEKEDLKKFNLKPAIDKLKKEADANKEMREKVKVSQTKVDQDIDQCFDKLKHALEERRAIIKKKCSEIAQEKDNILSDQFSVTEKLNTEFTFLQKQIDDMMTNYTLEELLSVKQVIKRRAKKRLDEFSSMDLTLKENEFIDMSIKIDTIADQIATIGFFSDVPDSDKCSVEGMVLPEAVVGFKREFKVIFRNEKNEKIKGKAMVQYKIERASDISDHQAAFTTTQFNGYTLFAVTPKAPGNLILTIMVRNIPLKGFPFTLKIRQPRNNGYNSLPNPNVLNPLSAPGNYISVSGNYIYVSTQDTVEVIDSNGTRKKTHKKNLSNPWGVAVIDVDREVYVSNRSTHNIQVNATAGEVVRSFGSNGNGNGQFNDPRGICNEGNGRILIADYGNRRVQIFSRIKESGTVKDTFFQSIPCSSNPIDVAVDLSGKIHVALHPANQVEVFSWNGDTYQSVEKYNIGGAPTGISVDASGYRFITESTNNQLHVFDPNGKQVLTKPGCSGGVAVDFNGIVYANAPNSFHINKF